LPRDLTFRLLTHSTWFEGSDPEDRRNHDDYAWSEIAKVFIQDYPDASVDLADNMLEHYGEEGTIVGGFHSSPHSILNEIAAQHPESMWECATKYLGPPIDSRAFHIKEWLRGEEFFGEGGTGALELIPLEQMWEWVDGDIENRAWYLASFVPKTLFREEGRDCIAREVLVRYGDREDVRRNFRANYSTEGWSGPESLHHQEKKRQLLAFREGEDNGNVIRWIDEYIQALDYQIERAKIREEREEY
jgi:hypothetical protein